MLMYRYSRGKGYFVDEKYQENSKLYQENSKLCVFGLNVIEELNKEKVKLGIGILFVILGFGKLRWDCYNLIISSGYNMRFLF